MRSTNRNRGALRGRARTPQMFTVVTVVFLVFMFAFFQTSFFNASKIEKDRPDNIITDPTPIQNNYGVVPNDVPLAPKVPEIQETQEPQEPQEPQETLENQETQETQEAPEPPQEPLEEIPQEIPQDISKKIKSRINYSDLKELKSIPGFESYTTSAKPTPELEDEKLGKLSTVKPNPLTGLTFTHVYSPFVGQKVAEATLVAASMNAAIAYAAERGINVEVVAVVLDSDFGSDELVLAENAKVVTVEKVFSDVYPNPQKGNVPFVSDIISAAHKVAGGSHTILTNPDIILEESFYLDVIELLERRPQDWQSITINRRTIPIDAIYGAEIQMETVTQGNKKVTKIPDEFYKRLGEENTEEILKKINSLDGEDHPGHDCFVFPTEWSGRLSQAMEGFVVGSPVWGCWFRFLVCERRGGIEASVNVSEFKESLTRSHLAPCTYTKYKVTRHLGNDKGWKKVSLPWVWNAMWLYIDVTRGFSGTDAYATEAISSCSSKKPCSAASVNKMKGSYDYQSFVTIYNRSCELYKKVKMKNK